MSNPNPKTDHLKPHQIPATSIHPLAKRSLSVKVDVEVDEAIRSLDDWTGWLRRVITEAATRELLPHRSAEGE